MLSVREKCRILYFKGMLLFRIKRTYSSLCLTWKMYKSIELLYLETEQTSSVETRLNCPTKVEIILTKLGFVS